eukprot:Colp12_sorted_trinity150504_noHs@1730
MSVRKPVLLVIALLCFAAPRAAFGAVCVVVRGSQDTTETTIVYKTLAANQIGWSSIIIPREGYSGQFELYDSSKTPLYQCIIQTSLSYNYGGNWRSPITEAQIEQLENFQRDASVKRVILSASADQYCGVRSLTGGTGVIRPIWVSSAAEELTEALNVNTPLSTEGLWHNPARVIDGAVTSTLLWFAPAQGLSERSAAAVITSRSGADLMCLFIDTGSGPSSVSMGSLWASWVVERTKILTTGTALPTATATGTNIDDGSSDGNVDDNTPDAAQIIITGYGPMITALSLFVSSMFALTVAVMISNRNHRRYVAKELHKVYVAHGLK